MLKKIRFLYPLLAVVILLAACAPVSVSDDGSKIDATQAAQMIEDAVAKALADAQATADADGSVEPLKRMRTRKGYNLGLRIRRQSMRII